ncbi:hypothetical protein GCM10025870_22130 [Agromyces marinus]|uniref:Luciferase-like domain-containing protein n=1 Tax=Agromyces marinus TaxID=1389020 RepID=A0ABN6YGF6_9MICO|nr:LLM class flavin-dependent oxidoreductase [Agromyces marinus]BDZ55140.1 hypothetical protein GCM10025870_22130 [Agromyces marinus]
MLRALAPRLERLGFHALWLNDVPHGDSLAGLAAVAGSSERLGLATGVIPLDRRPAASLDLAALPAARTTIGIGSGRAEQPSALVRSGIETLREGRPVRIAVGALGPGMRRLAAERADAVVLNWLTPAAATEAMTVLRHEAREPDGTARAVRGVLYLRTIVDEGARAELVREADRYGSYRAYAANFERLGVQPIDATLDHGAALGAFDVVDEIVLRAITANGTLGEFERFVEEVAGWRDAVTATE